MGKGISEVLPSAIGVAISPVPIIAVILMLFSRRADVRAGNAEMDGGVDAFTPPKAFGLAVLLVVVNPKNLRLTIGAATGLAQLGLSTADASPLPSSAPPRTRRPPLEPARGCCRRRKIRYRRSSQPKGGNYLVPAHAPVN